MVEMEAEHGSTGVAAPDHHTGSAAMVEVHTGGENAMASAPEVAPDHHEVRDAFPPGAVAFCLGVGILAIVLGIVLGLTLR